MVKIDPYGAKEIFGRWKEGGKKLGDISDKHKKLVLEYLDDMERGLYVKKKASNFRRLITLKSKMMRNFLMFEEYYKVKDITTDLTLRQKQITEFFKRMRNGEIKKLNGQQYNSVDSYARIFIAFWNWYIRKQADHGKTIRSITTYIDTSPQRENEFVYFVLDELKTMCNQAKFKYKALMWFMYDSGIRSPTELVNIRINDLSVMENSSDFELNIKKEISKTFGRRIKLLLCSDLLKQYIHDKGLKNDDQLFDICPKVVNQYLKRLALKCFGNKQTKGGKSFDSISMYDFRHSSVCYWLPRYKNEGALKYRFGWKTNEMVHYYSKLLGMKDTIVSDDLLVDSDAKTRLEKEVEILKKELTLLKEGNKAREEDMLKIIEDIIKERLSKAVKS